MDLLRNGITPSSDIYNVLGFLNGPSGDFYGIPEADGMRVYIKVCIFSVLRVVNLKD